jgi:arylsulfatase A-like enzyme
VRGGSWGRVAGVVVVAQALIGLPACRMLRDADKSDKGERPEGEKGRARAEAGRGGGGEGAAGRKGADEAVERVTIDPAQPLSVLFITWDTTRADHMSLYGYGRQTTPQMAELASQGVVFDRYIVPMSTTLPSHTSLFTGVRPEEHGIIANVSILGERFVPSEKLIPLAAWLKRAGFETGGFVSSTPVKRFTGIATGFEAWSEPRGDHRRGAETVDEAIAWLRAAPTDRPLFQWVHLYDPHAPYDAVPALADMFKGDPVAREEILTADYTGDGEKTDPRATQRIETRINAYDADVFYADRETARLVDAWRRSGRLDHTILIFVGDHGEGLGQHGHLEHGLTWDEQLHAPGFLIAPGLTPRHLPFPVSAHDILPTLLGLIDLPDEASYLTQSTGHDVLAADYTPLPVFSRSSLRQVRLGVTAEVALTTNQWKVIVPAEGKPLLFDLSKDPHEKKNIASRQPELAERMAEQAREMFKEQRALGVALGAGKTEKIADELVEELRGMGYME